MIGSKHIEINWKNFVQGMTTTNFTEDGGFSTGDLSSSSYVSIVNPKVNPGLLHFPELSVDKSTNLSGEIIASCEDAGATYNRLFVTDSGKFYGWDGTTLSAALATDSTRSYVAGKTDMTPYGPYCYGTSATYVWEWVVTTATISQTYFAFPNSSGSASWDPASYPHPVLVYEGNIYYANGPQLLRQTTVGGVPAEILLLPNYGEAIIALGIDPASGKMLISTQSGYNASGTKNKLSKVQYYNGYSNKVDKVVITDEMITCFYNNGGTVFIGYGQNFGYWSGTGIQFLRRLNIALDSDTLLYKHHVTSVGNILYMIEKHRIIAFGEVMQGQGRSWWYAYQNRPSGTATNLTNISNIGGNKLVFSFATSKFLTLDLEGVTAISGNGVWHSKIYDFPRAVTFNSITIQYSKNVSANTTIGELYIVDDTGTQTQIAVITTAETTKSIFDCPYPTIKSRSLQIQYIASENTGVERITMFYNDKE